uniref:Uncharacterized protein n=1 Tax=Parascaris univalens TaxID=6257 RepID=A0A915AD78_PARUN
MRYPRTGLYWRKVKTALCMEISHGTTEDATISEDDQVPRERSAGKEGVWAAKCRSEEMTIAKVAQRDEAYNVEALDRKQLRKQLLRCSLSEEEEINETVG